MGDKFEVAGVHLFCDADFAGYSISQRSTFGVHMVLHGGAIIFPTQGLSNTHCAVVCDIFGVERCVGNFGCRMVMVPAFVLWNVSFPRGIVPFFHGDAQASTVAKCGGDPTMRHLGCVHRGSVRWIHARLCDDLGRDEAFYVFLESLSTCAPTVIRTFSPILQLGVAPSDL